jgi:hypothetical protein
LEGFSGQSRETRRAEDWALRESERAIVLAKPGNAGGGKGPRFWCALEAV